MPNRLHAALAAVALLAWALFILACTGASWSPDGSKVLFSYIDPDARQLGVAYYDVNTGTASSLFVHAVDKSESLVFAQWQRDGSRALIFTHPSSASGAITLLAMPVGGSGITRQFTLPGVEREANSLPFPEINGNLFVDGTYLARLNLETGKLKLADTKGKETKFLFSDGARLFFARKRDAEVLVVGEVDQETLKRRPLFELDVGSVRKAGINIKEVVPLPAMSPRGGLLALVGKGEGKDAIVLCSFQGFERAFWPDLPLDSYVLSALEWSQDGHTLYASVLSNTTERTVVSVAEIPVDGSAGRLTELVRIPHDSYLESWRGLLQLPLSPDGRTLAISLADQGKDVLEPSARALYLVRVSDSERNIKVVPAPHAEYAPEELPDEPEEQKPPSPPPPPPEGAR